MYQRFRFKATHRVEVMAGVTETPMVITKVATNIMGTITIPTGTTIHTTDTNTTIDARTITITTVIIIIMLMPLCDMCIPITTVIHVNIA